jgi:hypothetical protein
MSLLVDMSSLITSETNKYLGDMPDSPDNIVILYNTGGFDSTHSLGTQKPSNENPTFQIRIRDTSYANAITRAEAIKDLLDGKCSTTVNSNNYISIFMVGDINSIGRDAHNRAHLTLNFKVKVKRG